MRTETARTPKEYNDDKMAHIYELFEKGNEGKSWNMGYYIIDTTGEHRVFFTLYKFKNSNSAYVNPYTFIKNVTSDFEKLEDIAQKINSQPIPVIVSGCDNYAAKVCEFRNRKNSPNPFVKFGKYAGKTIEEIWAIDKNYVVWFANNFTPKGESNAILSNQANEFKKLFFTELTEKNRATDTSNYLGKIKERLNVDAKVTSIKVNADYSVINLITKDGDNIFVYDKEYGLAVGDDVNIIGTATKHVEKLGKKFTYLNRIYITNEKPIVADTSNYLGEINGSINVDAKVTSIEVNGENKWINLVTKDGDNIFVYDEDYALSVGDDVNIIGTAKKHLQKLGKKFTFLIQINLNKL